MSYLEELLMEVYLKAFGNCFVTLRTSNAKQDKKCTIVLSVLEVMVFLCYDLSGERLVMTAD